MENHTCVFVGDGAVGKTSLIHALHGALKGMKKEGDGVGVSNVICGTRGLRLVDTDGGAYAVSGAAAHATSHIRAMAGESASVIVLLFSVISPASLEAAEHIWAPAARAALKSEGGNASMPPPILLVGTKVDLRTNERILGRLAARRLVPITKKDGQAAAKRMGAFLYQEVSLPRDALETGYATSWGSSASSNLVTILEHCIQQAESVTKKGTSGVGLKKRGKRGKKKHGFFRRAFSSHAKKDEALRGVQTFESFENNMEQLEQCTVL